MDVNEKMPASKQPSGRTRSGKARMQGLSDEQRSELARWAAAKRWAKPVGSEDTGMLLYRSEDGRTRIDVRVEDDTVWLTQAQMADLFQTSKQNINAHINKIYAEGELEVGATIKQQLIVQKEGEREVQRTIDLYNLDVIISVGYRVRSHRGTQFRIWATQRLKEYMVKGFALDDERLKNAGTRNDYFDELLRRVRDIRNSEKNFYRKITDVYATSIDYDPDATITHTFFATVQNKFHYAVTNHTAAEIIAERADSSKPNMGLVTFEGPKIRKSDVTVAKNYLTADEVESLNLLVEQYLSFAELQAKQRKIMHMQDWISKLDDFLKLNDREILTSAGRIKKSLADELAAAEYAKYSNLQRAIEKTSDVSDFDRYVRRVQAQRSNN